MKDPDNGWQTRRQSFRNTPRRNQTLDGRYYGAITYDRCACRNSKPIDQLLCDRCRELHALGYRMRIAIA